MELLVATWTLRLALVGALAVGGLSISAGTPLVESIDRAAIAAFAFTFLGRQLVGWLETPEQRVLRLRARRDKARGKGSKEQPRDQARPRAGAAGAGARAGTGAARARQAASAGERADDLAVAAQAAAASGRRAA